MPDDPSPASPPTMRTIALRAGVGKATVSLALRDDPRLRPETRRRIQKIAAKLGYRTNATVASLMAQLRASRTHRSQAILGLLDLASTPRQVSDPAIREWIKGCNERAVQLGYGIETVCVRDRDGQPDSIAEGLASRNIRGVIVIAPPGDARFTDDLEPIWERCAVVVAGAQPACRRFHFCANDQFVTTSQAVHRLWQHGCRRIGLALSPQLDASADRRFSAGFWTAQEELGGCGRIPAFPFDPAGEAAFRAWYRRHRPDAILTSHCDVKSWLEEIGVRIPDETALAHLDWHPDHSAWAGMDQHHALVGASSVDLLVSHLHANEAGLPKIAKAIFIQSSWIDGRTLDARPVNETSHWNGQPLAAESTFT